MAYKNRSEPSNVSHVIVYKNNDLSTHQICVPIILSLKRIGKLWRWSTPTYSFSSPFFSSSKHLMPLGPTSFLHPLPLQPLFIHGPTLQSPEFQSFSFRREQFPQDPTLYTIRDRFWVPICLIHRYIYIYIHIYSHYQI